MNFASDDVPLPDNFMDIGAVCERCLYTASILFGQNHLSEFRVVAAVERHDPKTWRAAVVALPEIASLAFPNPQRTTNQKDPSGNSQAISGSHKPTKRGHLTVLKSIRTTLTAPDTLYGAIQNGNYLPFSDWCRRVALRTLMFELEHDMADFLAESGWDEAPMSTESGDEEKLEEATVLSIRSLGNDSNA